MKFKYSIISILLIIVISCNKDDYKLGGELHNPNINMTTYDYLKSNRLGLFDTLLLLVDKAGIKEKINQKGVTFFAPTDYAINNYVLERTLAIQKVDPFKVWTVDSIMKYELAQFADSMDIYFVKDFLPNSKLVKEGETFKNFKSTNVVVSYEETNTDESGANDNSSVLPRVVYFTYLFQDLPSGLKVQDIEWPIGDRTLVQTSNAQTTTGALHVLNNSHTLFYFR